MRVVAQRVFEAIDGVDVSPYDPAIVSDTTGNMVLANAIRDVQDSVRQGESLTAPLADHPVFPPMVVQMLAVGEETGAVDELLERIADFYEEEVDVAVAGLLTLLEPVMIAFLGGVVGGIVIAMYMPIFDIAGAVKAE